jgi:uncharacterized membrane protein
MALMIIGLLIFFGGHLLPSIPSVREGLVANLGVRRYRLVYSLVALLGLVLVVIGYSGREYIHVWPPLETSRAMALHGMPLAFFLLAAANMQTWTRRLLRHPMSLGVLLWAGLHLAANGDLYSVILFGSFAAYAAFSMISAEVRGKVPANRPAAIKFDFFALVGAVLVYFAILHAHGWLFGVALR